MTKIWKLTKVMNVVWFVFLECWHFQSFKLEHSECLLIYDLLLTRAQKIFDTHLPIHGQIYLEKIKIKWAKEKSKLQAQERPVSQETGSKGHKDESSRIPSLLNALWQMLWNVEDLSGIMTRTSISSVFR